MIRQAIKDIQIFFKEKKAARKRVAQISAKPSKYKMNFLTPKMGKITLKQAIEIYDNNQFVIEDLDGNPIYNCAYDEWSVDQWLAFLTNFGEHTVESITLSPGTPSHIRLDVHINDFPHWRTKFNVFLVVVENGIEKHTFLFDAETEDQAHKDMLLYMAERYELNYCRYALRDNGYTKRYDLGVWHRYIDISIDTYCQEDYEIFNTIDGEYYGKM